VRDRDADEDDHRAEQLQTAGLLAQDDRCQTQRQSGLDQQQPGGRGRREPGTAASQSPPTRLIPMSISGSAARKRAAIASRSTMKASSGSTITCTLIRTVLIPAPTWYIEVAQAA